MKKAFALAAALLLAFSLAASADGTPVRYSVDTLKSITWTEGTPYYDNVCFVYNNSDDPLEDYSLTCTNPDMSNALSFETEQGTVTVLPAVMGSYDSALPYIEIDCAGDFPTPISDVRLDSGVVLEMHFEKDSGFATVNDGLSAAVAANLGSNVFTLMRALSENGGRMDIRVTFLDGTTAEGSVGSDGENPWRWYYEALQVCGLLDAEGRVQEDLRLQLTRLAITYENDPAFTLSGAAVIDDLADSIASQPLKLEYAESMSTVPAGSFLFSVINYTDTFVRGTGSEITGFDIAWTAMDDYGKALTLTNGDTVGTVHYDRAITPGGQFSTTVSAGLPEGTSYVRVRITSISFGDGSVFTVPERDLVSVDYQPGGVSVEYDFGL